MDAVTGTPVDKAIDILLPGIRTDHQDIKNILTGFEKIYVGKNGGVLYPDVLTGINKLSQLFKIFIVSNCEEWYLKKFIEFSGLGEVLAGSDCFGSSGVEKYLMINNIKTSHNLGLIVYVGDTMHDHTAAKLSHSDFIQMTYGFGKPISDSVQCRTFDELTYYLLS
jgi:phosphoglycolate phosphatase